MLTQYTTKVEFLRKQTTFYWVNTYISNTYLKTLKFTLDYTIIISFHNITWKRKTTHTAIMDIRSYL